MRQFSLTIIYALLLLPTSAQGLIDGAESVAYHPGLELYFVSSLNTNRVITIDKENNQSIFYNGIIAFGNCIKGDTLFLSSGSVVNGIDVYTKQRIMSINISGARQLDGMTYDNNNNLYVVETLSNQIIKIDITDGSYEYFVSEGLETSTQDLIYDSVNNRIFACAYGSNTSIVGIDPETGEITKLKNTVGRFDGITIDDRGFVYLGTHYNGGQIIMYDNDFNLGPMLIHDGIEEPAGLDFNVENRTLAIPGFSDDRVDFVELPQNYFYPEFSIDIESGHAPLSVQFNDRTLTNYSLNTWEWDFNNDGIIDSREQNPVYIYTAPGEYTVSLKVNNETDFVVIKENLINVFDGESSILVEDNQSYIKINSDLELNLTNEFTIEAYVKLSNFPSSIKGATILDKSAIRFYITGNALGAIGDYSLVASLKLANGNQVTITAPSDIISLDVWQNVGLAFSAETSTATFYINGTPYSATVVGAHPIDGTLQDNSEASLYIGNEEAMMSNLSGLIDEVRVWNYYKTDEQIMANLFNALTGSEENLIGYWSMNEACGEVVYDNSINSNNGILASCSFRQGVEFNAITSSEEVKEPETIEKTFQLMQNYPNPFNPTTIIKYKLANSSHVQLTIYNILGSTIIKAIDEVQSSGFHSFKWEGRDIYGNPLCSGIYLCELKVNQMSITKKMTLIK